MLDAGGGGFGGSTAGSDLERGVGALKRFQKHVNGLLKEFEHGPGGSTKVDAQRVTRAAFSGSNVPFAEADGFFTQYNRVHSELVRLSRFLGDQIEMLSIAVHGAEVGFDNLEEEQRRRFHSIQARLDRDQEQREREEQAKHAKPETPNTNDKTSESGW
ncbi:hypothetical protein [Streptomyces sp. NPDC051776]|uniref:hypothetical protein n=1 Tax=Streptomyces sp. NPDC051776 TaxID=3155414 RepID=UPI00341EBD86